MNLKTFLLAQAAALLLTGAACAQESIYAYPVQLYYPIAARGYAPAVLNSDFINPRSHYAAAGGGPGLKLSAVGEGRYGRTSLRPDGSVVYSPGPDFNGEDTFDYTVTVPGGSATSTITLTDFNSLSGMYILDLTYIRTIWFSLGGSGGGGGVGVVGNGGSGGYGGGGGSGDLGAIGNGGVGGYGSYGSSGGAASSTLGHAPPSPTSTIGIVSDSTNVNSFGLLTLSAAGSFTLRCNGPYPGATAASFNQYGYAYLDRYVELGEISLSLTLQNGAPVLSGQNFNFDFYQLMASGQKIAAAGAKAGRYTVLIEPPANAQPQDPPHGIGWAAMNVMPNGLMTMTGQGSSGYPFGATAALCAGGNFSIYSTAVTISPAHSLTLMALTVGTANFRDARAVSDFDGTILESPIAGSTASQIIGSRFTPAASGGRLLTFTTPNGAARLTFQGGDLTEPISALAFIAPGDVAGGLAAPLQSLSITTPAQIRTTHGSALFAAAEGEFSGAFTEPVPILQSWMQSSAGGFPGDTENNVSPRPDLFVPSAETYVPGVTLATTTAAPGAPVPGCIQNPGFELPFSTGWSTFALGYDASFQELGAGNDPVFPTQGALFAAIFVEGDFSELNLSQKVNLDGVSTLSFDARTAPSPSQCQLYIDNDLVWNPGSGLYLNQSIDVSYLGGGSHTISFDVFGSDDQWLYLDNLQAFGPYAFESAGSLVSAPITPQPFLKWYQLIYDTVTPTGTAITVDVLDANGNLLKANVANGADLSTVPAVASQSSILLRANLSTSNPTVSPKLMDWSVSWQSARPIPTRRSFRGVVFQKQNIAAGVFVGAASAGSIILKPE